MSIIGLAIFSVSILNGIPKPLPALELAKAERNYLISQITGQDIANQIEELKIKCNIICKQQGKVFDANSIACVKR